ncbi:MAG: hypothetical protein EXR75_15920 [Myxococcales bacterium]|nr:hypothetical protein [Myxococcales bacterium]
MFRRLSLCCLLAGAALVVELGSPLDGAREAAATVSVAHSLEELVRHSTRVVIATAKERTSRWEEIGGGKRIVTYTRLAIAVDIVGTSTPELWVRTLGGAVDGIGQVVAGEASLVLGERSLAFLTPVEDGALHVMGMADGHFPLLLGPAADDGKPRVERLRRSPAIATVLERKRGPSAAVTLVGKTTSEATGLIQKVASELAAKKPR